MNVVNETTYGHITRKAHQCKNRRKEEEVMSKDWCEVKTLTSTGRHDG